MGDVVNLLQELNDRLRAGTISQAEYARLAAHHAFKELAGKPRTANLILAQWWLGQMSDEELLGTLKVLRAFKDGE